MLFAIAMILFPKSYCYAQTSSVSLEKADVNGDKSVDISDIVAVINYMAYHTGNNKKDPAVEAGFCPDSHHPHTVDMLYAGIWSCCNMGASAPWEYGGYYAWGEIWQKDNYNWLSYKFCDGTENTPHNIGENICLTDYDVAHMCWEGKWRMPTYSQFEALKK